MKCDACCYCEEPVIGPRPLFNQPIHKECLIRMTVGSTAHQFKRCTCYGGTGEDSPAMSKRDAARDAYETFLLLRSIESGRKGATS